VTRAGGLVALALAACAADAPAGPRVDLLRADGSLVRELLSVERVDTPDGRARGLIGHVPLGPDGALVLDYPVVDQACITNAEVEFPITVVFAAAGGAVRAVESLAAHDARAPCHDGVLTVVELAADARSDADRAARVVVR
jgi:uncharacterized membrane protein (UPF0127 family)